MTDSASTPEDISDISAMTDKAELLAQLREVHVPDVSFWPAPGWWLLLVLFIVFIIALKLRKRQQVRYENEAWRREALVEMSRLQSRLPQTTDSERHDLVQQASALLRRVMMQSFGRKQVAALTANDWLSEVSTRSAVGMLDDSLQPLLTDVPYQTKPNDLSSEHNVGQYFLWLQQTIEGLPNVASTQGAKL